MARAPRRAATCGPAIAISFPPRRAGSSPASAWRATREAALASFIADNFPSLRQILLLGPLGLALAATYLYAAGVLKRDHGWRTGYSRKVFHFLVFTTAASTQAALGVAALFVFGAATSAVIFYAVVRGSGHVLFEAMARESDAPRQTRYIVIPYLATLCGGLLANALFGRAAVVGYLVAGLGDAIGEPVGTRFGRHRYRVPSRGDVISYRSYEGSLAVFAVSLLAVLVGEVALDAHQAGVGAAIVIALAAALVEAGSPHGWDNLTMQVVPAGLAAWLIA